MERLAPDGLRDLFPRVEPEAPTRPQGGGGRRYGDRVVLVEISLVTTTG